MRFTLSSTALSSKLSALSRVINSKNALPILSDLVFEINDNVLRLTASDSENIMKMARLIAKYTTQDVSRGAALEYVLSGSPAEEKIKKFNNGWAPSHKEERFEDMEVSDFWVLSEDCLVCHVKFTYILTSKRQNDYPYPTDYTFCIRRRNGEGKLYDVVFH